MFDAGGVGRGRVESPDRGREEEAGLPPVSWGDGCPCLIARFQGVL